ncbi:hemerythrin domain-containing protein [Massilia horti]|uniref:Hemerythrin domain-containing protein n=1 Tax=Massilia horti TaxID=2562153 RepID=A0A4Y9T4P2_9BURK|nr:hemerythrin domain-containing protein [Massilia horti]TFW35156.1 hemerythrin domain-containing protein [Massilia horti]
MDKNHANDTAEQPAGDAISVLCDDHNRLRGLFKYFGQLKGDGATTERMNVAEEICKELLIHTIIEEELFYPAAREVVTDELIDEAQVEHDAAKHLMQQLIPMRQDNSHFCAKMAVLRESVKHHMEEEEEYVFPKVKSSRLDLAMLGKELLQRRTELRDELKTVGNLVGFQPVKHFVGKQRGGSAARINK